MGCPARPPGSPAGAVINPPKSLAEMQERRPDSEWGPLNATGEKYGEFWKCLEKKVELLVQMEKDTFGLFTEGE